jgi:hypothetical protein
MATSLPLVTSELARVLVLYPVRSRGRRRRSCSRADRPRPQVSKAQWLLKPETRQSCSCDSHRSRQPGRRPSPTSHRRPVTNTNSAVLLESVSSSVPLFLSNRVRFCLGLSHPVPGINHGDLRNPVSRWAGVGLRSTSSRQKGSCCLTFLPVRFVTGWECVVWSHSNHFLTMKQNRADPGRTVEQPVKQQVVQGRGSSSSSVRRGRHPGWRLLAVASHGGGRGALWGPCFEDTDHLLGGHPGL